MTEENVVAISIGQLNKAQYLKARKQGKSARLRSFLEINRAVEEGEMHDHLKAIDSHQSTFGTMSKVHWHMLIELKDDEAKLFSINACSISPWGSGEVWALKPQAVAQYLPVDSTDCP